MNRCDLCRHKRHHRDDQLECLLPRNKGKPVFRGPRWPHDDDWGWMASCNDFDLEHGADILSLRREVTRAIELIKVGKVHDAKALLEGLRLQRGGAAR